MYPQCPVGHAGGWQGVGVAQGFSGLCAEWKNGQRCPWFLSSGKQQADLVCKSPLLSQCASGVFPTSYTGTALTALVLSVGRCGG